MRLSAHGVGHRYQERVVLSGVDLTVAGGELLAVVGPNGSGKSTLLRRLSGSLRGPGVVLLDGADLTRLPARLLAQRVTMLEQEVSTDFAFRVEDLVFLGRHPYRVRLGPMSPRDRAAVRQAMDAMGILDLAPRLFSQLSGGERRKVLLAAVLAQEPQVLLLDEPTAHLDVHHQFEITSLLSRLAEDGRAVLCALHDLNLAAAFAHRLLLLKGGRVVALGLPAEVLTRELLREVFGVDALVAESPATGRLVVHFLIPSRAATPSPSQKSTNPDHPC